MDQNATKRVATVWAYRAIKRMASVSRNVQDPGSLQCAQKVTKSYNSMA